MIALSCSCTHIRAKWRHLPYGISQCYLPPDTSEHAPSKPAKQAGTRFTYPIGMTWWPVTYKDGLPAHRRSAIHLVTRQCTAGVEPATCWSQVRRANHYTIKPPCIGCFYHLDATPNKQDPQLSSQSCDDSWISFTSLTWWINNN